MYIRQQGFLPLLYWPMGDFRWYFSAIELYVQRRLQLLQKMLPDPGIPMQLQDW
jgi:hypothetical protein